MVLPVRASDSVELSFLPARFIGVYSGLLNRYVAANSSAVHVSPRDQIDFVLGQASDARLEGQRPTVESLEPPPTLGRGSACWASAHASQRQASWNRCQFQSAHAKTPGAGHTGSWARLSMDQCGATPEAIFQQRPCCSKGGVRAARLHETRGTVWETGAARRTR
jgi:hypothetical protein